MDAQFTHLSGDIRQPVLIVGDDPDVEGNVLYAPLLPVQSIGKLNLFDSAVDSPTDTVDDGAAAQDTTAGDDTVTSTVIDTSRDQSTDEYADNGDGTFTRTSDGVRGHFGPGGFIESGGESVTGVAWGEGT